MIISKAIKKINPNAEFTYQNNDISTIQWLNGTTPIPKADIEAKMVELQAEYDAEQWKRNRQSEYPSIDDCIHALLDGEDTLTELQAKRTAIKNKYPKSGA
jgi:MarR-like DNA-binding transcriptional regulator SgrR of sgrS sRNA